MSHESNDIRITPADRAAIDALVESRFNARAVADEQRERCGKIAGLFALLDNLPEQRTGDLLTQRTLAKVAAARQQERFSQHIDQLAKPASLGMGLGVSLRDLLALAAVMLIAASLLWPVLDGARGTARQIACRQNLALAGAGFAGYSSAYNGSLPATKARLGDSWWLTGQFDEQGYARSNSAHLFMLTKAGYVKLDALSCPENCFAPRHVTVEDLQKMRDWQEGRQASFSYQNQYAANRFRMDRGDDIALLADKNPFFEPGKYRFKMGTDRANRASALSENHARRGGQNVLLSGGEVEWIFTDRLANRDNIFHVGNEGLDNYTGLEGPADVDDSFLVW